MPIVGKYIVILGLVLFAFSTIIGWSYYGEKCAEFLFGNKIIKTYRFGLNAQESHNDKN